MATRIPEAERKRRAAVSQRKRAVSRAERTGTLRPAPTAVPLGRRPPAQPVLPTTDPIASVLTGGRRQPSQLSITETARAAMMAASPALVRPGPGLPARAPARTIAELGAGAPAGAQMFDTNSLAGLSPVELQTRSSAPWQPNVGPAVGSQLSQDMARVKEQRERQEQDNATLASAQRSTPRATLSPGVFGEPPEDTRSLRDYIDQSVAFKQQVLAGNAPAERPAAFIDSENKRRDRGVGGRGRDLAKAISAGTVNEEKFRARQEERADRKDISQRLVMAKAQGRRQTTVGARKERAEERKQTLVDRLLGEGKELPRDLRSPQENANADALQIKAMESASAAIAGLGEAATPEMAETIFDRLSISPAGGAPGATVGEDGIDATALRTGTRLADTLIAEDPELIDSPKDWEKLMRARGTPSDVIEQIGSERFANWAIRHDPNPAADITNPANLGLGAFGGFTVPGAAKVAGARRGIRQLVNP